MVKRNVYDDVFSTHYITFACYKRRRLLDDDRNKQIVLGVLDDQLTKQNAKCAGFAIMPDHVHATIWFPETGQLSSFVRVWKQRSSFQIKRIMAEHLKSYFSKISKDDPVWQPGYYDFNIYSEEKLREKLEYMHNNPVRAGFVGSPESWKYSSARYFSNGKSVGVPIEFPG